MSKAVSRYKEHEIDLDHKMRFVVKGPLVDDEAYTSYEEATGAIDKEEKNAAREKTTNLKLTILKPDGSGETQIKGINPRTCRLTFTEGAWTKSVNERSYSYGDDESVSVRNVYPPAQWIVALLKELAVLNARRREIAKALQPHGIGTDRGYIVKQNLDEAVHALGEEYNKKCAAAAKLEKKAKTAPAGVARAERAG